MLGFLEVYWGFWLLGRENLCSSSCPPAQLLGASLVQAVRGEGTRVRVLWRVTESDSVPSPGTV